MSESLNIQCVSIYLTCVSEQFEAHSRFSFERERIVKRLFLCNFISVPCHGAFFIGPSHSVLYIYGVCLNALDITSVNKYT